MTKTSAMTVQETLIKGEETTCQEALLPNVLPWEALLHLRTMGDPHHHLTTWEDKCLHRTMEVHHRRTTWEDRGHQQTMGEHHHRTMEEHHHKPTWEGHHNRTMEEHHHRPTWEEHHHRTMEEHHGRTTWEEVHHQMQDGQVTTTTTSSRVVECSSHSTRTAIHQTGMAAGTRTRVRIVEPVVGFLLFMHSGRCIGSLRKVGRLKNSFCFQCLSARYRARE
ncbi:hypothetical protein F2Q70_00037308 [Brassica cretica]|uniref:Uncharacterized protein n=1 Tax=Brassica cretica TaxID=69181 RepID=A0A8S9JS60_BRACR|nr:hypothetical protein F2Q70_00037308 [Brassica cretica]